MYILLRDSIPVGHQVNCAAHASLACYLKFKDHPETQEWLENSFRKVTCSVSDKEFEKAKECEDWVCITEDAIGDAEVALAFRPRKEYPKRFQWFKLYGRSNHAEERVREAATGQADQRPLPELRSEPSDHPVEYWKAAG
jgi:hypothetical protein